MRRQFPKAQSAFYDIKARDRAEGEPSATDVWVYDVIGDDWVDPSLTAKQMCQAIAAIDTDEIVLHLNSPGGSVSDGIAIYNALLTHPAKVTSIVEGWTGSIATVIALAGDDVQMFDNTMFMIHNPWSICVGNASEMRDFADYLDRVGALMSAVYMSRCSKTPDELQAALDAETYLTAGEAAEWGFVDQVVEGVRAAAKAEWSGDILEALGFSPVQTLDVSAAGRVLSAVNETRLRDAAALIDTVLAALDTGAGDEDDSGSGDASPTIDTQALASLVTATKRH